MTTHSAYRHIYGEASKPEQSYREVKVNSTSVDSNLLAANARFIAIPWESVGGGVFCVVPAGGCGKIGTSAPKFTGHNGVVTDVAFNPFNDYMVASAADDATFRLWQVIEKGGEVMPSSEPLAIFKGHGRRVGRVVFNPLVENAVATFGGENAIKLWDITKTTAVATIKCGKENIMDLNWSQDGKLVAAPIKDKTLRVYDIRTEAEAMNVASHAGLRGSRVVFDSALNYVVTTGYGSNSVRQIYLRDMRSPEKPIGTNDVDSNTGVLAPFMDSDLHVLYLMARGDTSIKYFELRTDEKPLMSLNSWSHSESIRAFAHAPKYAVSVQGNEMGCEIDRFYFVTSSKDMHKLQMIVPKKNASDFFAEDLYPPTPAPEPCCSFDEWKGGKDPEPKLISLENFELSQGGDKTSNFKVEADDVDSLKAENARLKARIAELEKQLGK